MPFVSFEGIDGCGKTTQLDRLASRLEGEGKIVLRTKEPGGGALGGVVRAIFTRKDAPPMSHMEQMLLVNAARFDHVRSVIIPALADGAWVLTDRFYDSTFALQVFETDVPTALFEMLRDAVVGEVRPDLTFVLDLPAVSAHERRGGRPSDDPLEQHRDFERIRRGFRAAAASDPARCRLIDASGSEEVVGAAIHRELWTRFSDGRG
ncbi:MAG: dTMP kinase [Brevundimonas sp.]|uniref:dTMP kinase n=1 Tax=Brevundimonas sp. TaxID=1871086 RepID=UPI0012221E52|nr:dTMP kinase [Brevundimonas sp.]RZJ18618.1 MAG: dTMP kinase [Brevundimonas sp.]